MSGVQHFLQRPVVDAMQWTGDNYKELSDWMFGKNKDARCMNRGVESTFTNPGDVLVFWADDACWSVAKGDWVVLAPYGWSAWAEHVFAACHDPFDGRGPS